MQNLDEVYYSRKGDVYKQDIGYVNCASYAFVLIKQCLMLFGAKFDLYRTEPI